MLGQILTRLPNDCASYNNSKDIWHRLKETGSQVFPTSRHTYLTKDTKPKVAPNTVNLAQ